MAERFQRGLQRALNTRRSAGKTSRCAAVLQEEKRKMADRETIVAALAVAILRDTDLSGPEN